ncbi:hypothetical protein ACV54C_003623, partial [Yersinia enterocolitica]
FKKNVFHAAGCYGTKNWINVTITAKNHVSDHAISCLFQKMQWGRHSFFRISFTNVKKRRMAKTIAR